MASKDHVGYIDSTAPSTFDYVLGTDYTADGFIGSDAFTVPPTFSYDPAIPPILNDIDKTYVIQPSGGAVSSNYTIEYSQTQGKLTVEKVKCIIYSAPVAASLTYNSTAQLLLTSLGNSNGGTIEYSIDGGETWSTAPPTATEANTYTIHYRAKGDYNHYDSHAGTPEDPYPSLTVIIETADFMNPDPSLGGLVIEGIADLTYCGKQYKQVPTNITYNGMELEKDKDYTVSYEEDKNYFDAGDYKVIITGVGNYKGEVDKSFTVNKKELTVSVINKEAKVGTQAPSLTNSELDKDYAVTGFISGETLSTHPILSYETQPPAIIERAGATYQINASAASAGDNYTITYVPGTLTT
ncbi:MAG: hypothetical protein HUJ76_13315, partial [Parasporobacterium sp.]|nr:hypothetical protein [Parasporobacterium sp.]